MPNEERNHAVVVVQQSKTLELARAALGRAGIGSDAGGAVDAESLSVPAEVRSIRRGKFFLSRQEQTKHGSIRRPIFQYYCHGVVVGETVMDEEKDGMWCFAAHNDFDLIPETTKPGEWPEYTRTPTGWVRADGARRIEQADTGRVDKLIERINTVKRLL
jgi:hypothetical protein